MKELVSVIIPILDPHINPTEEKLLQHALEMLSGYPIIFTTYEHADLSIVKEHAEHIDVVTFPKRFFESRQHFGKLLLMEDFYERFNWCDFLLVHELNSWVIRDELHYWCKQGYDYIKSGPVTSTSIPLDGTLKRLLGLSDDEKRVYGEGYTDNGLYLCRIERMTAALKGKKRLAHQYRHDDRLINPDSVFWDLEANRFWPHLRKPTGIVRNHFAQHAAQFENRKTLPFALTGISRNNIQEMSYFKTLPETE